MKKPLHKSTRIWTSAFAFVLLGFFVYSVGLPFLHEPVVSQFDLKKFGNIIVRKNRSQTHGVAIILVNQKVEMGSTLSELLMAQAIAQELALRNILGAIVSKSQYNQMNGLHSKECFNAGDEMLAMSQSIEQAIGLKNYYQPLIIDISGGLNLGERAFREAPKNSFTGLISRETCDSKLSKQNEQIHFCPDFSTSQSSFVQKRMLASHPEHLPWLIVGEMSCPEQARSKSHRAEFLPNLLPSDYQINLAWVESFADHVNSFHQSESLSENVNGLPLIEILPEQIKSSHFVVLYSGDGGWAEFDESLANAYRERGIPVIGVDSLKYFWTKREPRDAAEDLKKLISRYQKKLRLEKFSLVGFSFGADVLPFLIDKLPPSQRHQIESVSLLALSERVEFEFHLRDWLSSNDEGILIAPALEKLSDLKIKCLYGSEENQSLCSKLNSKFVQRIMLPGNHHFDGRIDLIMDHLK